MGAESNRKWPRISIALVLFGSLSILGGLGLWLKTKPFKTMAVKETPKREAWEGRDQVVVLTRNAPTIFYYDRDGRKQGFEYELASQFVRQHLGRRPVFRSLDSTKEILDALKRGEGDFAAAGLTHTAPRAQEFLFGPSYATVEQLVVCHPKERVTHRQKLIGKNLVVAARSSYIDLLHDLQREAPGISYATTSEKNTEELLEEVAEHRIACTITDSTIFKLVRPNFPHLQVALSLGQSGFLAWAAPQDRPKLVAAMHEWFMTFSKTPDFAAMQDRYFGHVEDFDYYDIVVFRQRINSRLPKYMDLIQKAAESSGFPAPLLAAIAYQESHWDPEGKSPTGVRGFMMLTRDTAKELGVSNRLDPEQSMLAGSRFIRQLYDRLPEHLNPQDRMWFALVAYNMGYYHMRDARHLAIDLGLNPNTWQSMQKVLPLLSKKAYYKRTRYGYARGYEALSYIKRIKAYRAILAKFWPKVVSLESQKANQTAQ